MNDHTISFNILIKKEKDLFVAHCLELDIVASSKLLDQVKTDINSLISAQLDYAFRNDNLDNLYHPAPVEAWREFFACKEVEEQTYPIATTSGKTSIIDNLIPHWLNTKTCQLSNLRHV